MNEITGLAMVVLGASIIVAGVTVIAPAITGYSLAALPGEEEGANLTSEINTYTEQFNTMSQDESNIGVGGLIAFISLVLFGVPKYASLLLAGIVSWLHLPILVANVCRAAIYMVYIVGVGVLLYRGVKS